MTREADVSEDWDFEEVDAEYELEDDEEDDSPAWYSNGAEDDDFPDEEEDEDNPDWYRLREPDHELTPEEQSDFYGTGMWEDVDASMGVAAGAALSVHYDDEGYYGYVLIGRLGGEATRQDVRSVHKALNEAGLLVVRSGPSRRTANDGVMYDWYLRVQGRGGRKPSRQDVERALIPFAQSEVRSSTTTRQERSGVLERRITTLEVRLEHQIGLTASLREANTELRRQLAVARRTAEVARDSQWEIGEAYVEQIRRLRTELSGIRDDAEAARHRAELFARAAQDATAQVDAEKRKTEEFISTFDQDVAERDARIAQLEEMVVSLEGERGQLAFQRDQACEDAEKLREHLRRVGERTPRRKHGLTVDEVFKALLPTIDLLPGSADELEVELPNRIPVLKRLRELAAVGHCPGQKAIRGVSGWFELHYSTGQSDDGRLYFARGKNGRFSVLISRKRGQRRDISRLRMYRF